MSLKSALFMGLSAIVVLASGCASTRRPATVWTPQPKVQWADIAAPAGFPSERGHKILVTGQTQGLFPASMAVTRLTAVNNVETGVREFSLLADPRNEFLQWNSTLDDKMAISEVFPIAERDLGGNEPKPAQILAAFKALHARVGLIYAVNELSENESEMLGVLYDVKAASPIATIHARAQSVPPSESKKGKDVDLWKTDSRALVRAGFAGSFRDCIRELIAQDAPPAIETPEGWRRAAPTRPVDWPPRGALGAP